ncbi:spermatogenesis-associated protein 6-like [Rhopilema esculentum]|uniref:spermatogenesis-associated protein 6-like n=1 Tax=Rhopilema esculentum TaxID=499914 RepID=UPI0031E439AA
MPRPALKCHVNFKVKQVACPGTLHLTDRNFVFVTVSLLAQTRRTKSVFASFPFVFNEKLMFERIFTNARTLDHVLEILEDEIVSIELRQYSERYDDGKVLARFEQCSRQFLFPTPSFAPKDDVNREILLARTQNYPIERGIDPQLSFTTSTRIEETSIASSSREHLSRSRISPTRTTNSARKIPLVRPPSSSSETEEEAIITTPRRKHSPKRSVVKHEEHCICECPNRLESYRNGLPSKSVSPSRGNPKKTSLHKPPFKAGRAPQDLISKRDFNNSPRRYQRITFGDSTVFSCPKCLLPAPDCTNCTTSPNGSNRSVRHQYVENSVQERPRSSPHPSTRGNRSPSSKPGMPTVRARIPITLPVSFDDEDRYRAALAVSSERNRNRARIFENSDSPEHNITRSHVRSTVKDLLRKNDSVLQYELTDSELEDSLMSDISDDDVPMPESPSKRSISKEVPGRSVVVPLSARKCWSSDSHHYTNKTHRQLFNDSMSEIYKDLYRKATGSD